MTTQKTSVKLSSPLVFCHRINYSRNRTQPKSCVTKWMVANLEEIAIKPNLFLHSLVINKDQEPRDQMLQNQRRKISWTLSRELWKTRSSKSRDSRETLMSWEATSRCRCANLKNKSDFRRISQRRVNDDLRKIRPKSVSETWDIMRSARLPPNSVLSSVFKQ